MLFKTQIINSGLLTISKHEIVYTDFTEFKARSGVDSLCAKGVLYSQIKDPSGSIVHVFNTHLQATYHNDYLPDNKNDHNNFMARLNQIVELRTAIDGHLAQYSKLYKDGPDKFKDIIFVLGDFNVNSKGKHLPQKNFSELEWVKKSNTPEFSEYEFLIATLSRLGKDKIIDLAFESYGYHPTTFGDVIVEDEVRKPRDISLTNTPEHMSEQSLDYIFQLVPAGSNQEKIDFELNPKHCKVNEFFVEGESLFTQLSDHYGIECAFKMRKFN